jgi:hypothetical protein
LQPLKHLFADASAHGRRNALRLFQRQRNRTPVNQACAVEGTFPRMVSSSEGPKNLFLTKFVAMSCRDGRSRLPAIRRGPRKAPKRPSRTSNNSAQFVTFTKWTNRKDMGLDFLMVAFCIALPRYNPVRLHLPTFERYHVPMGERTDPHGELHLRVKKPNVPL